MPKLPSSDHNNPPAAIGDEPNEFEAAAPPTEADLARVVQLARQQIALEDEIEALESTLKEKKASLQVLSQATLPLALAEHGLTGLPLQGGYAIKLKQMAGGSITETNRPAAHAWLEENKEDALIKRTITITFDRDEAAWAAKFMRDMAQRKRPLKAQLKEAVNHQTLGVWVRERLAQARAAGGDPHEALPWELFGVYDFKQAEVARPRVKP